MPADGLDVSARDVSDLQERSTARYKRAGLTAGSSAVARVVALLGSLVTVPLALNYLGPERYGVWITISSFVALLAFADLGLGNGLMTAISRAQGEQDVASIRSFVSSGLAMLLVATPVLGIALAIVVATVDWGSAFNVTGEATAAEASGAIVVFVVLFVLGLAPRLTEKMQWGLQEGYVAGLWQALGSVLTVAGVLVAIAVGADLRGFVAVLLGAPLLAAILNGVHTFGRRHTELRPRGAAVSSGSVKELLKLGGLFLGLQVATAVAFTSDNIVVAQTLGADAVPQLAVPFQLFGFLSVVVGMLLMPLWPAYGEAIGSGDAAWVRTTLRRSMVGAIVLTGIGSIVLVLVGRTILDLWVGSAITPTTSLLLAL
ncbi:MAG: lipopolysaccharide biosynthesis protein, partial [Acidimicrobiia bacterium]